MAAETSAAALRRLIRDADCQGSPLPDAPTAALPGTAEKQLVIAARIRARRAGAHPDDLTFDDARSLGLSFTVGPNGAVVWIRPTDEQTRRVVVLTLLQAARVARGRAG